jgi:hypothetical protein
VIQSETKLDMHTATIAELTKTVEIGKADFDSMVQQRMAEVARLESSLRIAAAELDREKQLRLTAQANELEVRYRLHSLFYCVH